MPAYKDKNNGTWYCKFYYKDWSGVLKQKWKRGFDTKKEAQEFERNFLQRKSFSQDILLDHLLYFNKYLLYLCIKNCVAIQSL